AAISAAGAPRARAEDLERVAHIGEAVFLGEPVGPPLHRGTLHLDGGAAGPADQVVVVRTAAQPVQLLPAGQSHGVDLARVDEQLQGAVDGGQADLGAALPEVNVQLLRGPEVVHLL